MKFLHRNIERQKKEEAERLRRKTEKQEYMSIINEVCPVDFETSFFDSYDVYFKYIGILPRKAGLPHGITLNRNIYYNVTSKEQLRIHVNYVCDSVRRRYEQ